MLRRCLLVPALVALVSLMPAARGFASEGGHGTDLFAGYSYANITETSRHGADVAVGFDLFGPLSGFVDLSTHWGSEDGGTFNDLTLMAGPGLRFGKRGGTVFFVRALAGLVRDKFTIGILDVDLSESQSRLGAMGGGGVDFRVATALAVRVQGDYLWNDVEQGKSSGYRAAAGVVYRFGSAR
jgi:hypothetical protein